MHVEATDQRGCAMEHPEAPTSGWYSRLSDVFEVLQVSAAFGSISGSLTSTQHTRRLNGVEPFCHRDVPDLIGYHLILATFTLLSADKVSGGVANSPCIVGCALISDLISGLFAAHAERTKHSLSMAQGRW